MKQYAPIDKAGRVVIPKALRDALGLEAGAELEMELEGDSLVVRARAAGSGCLRAKGDLLVLSCGVEGETDHRRLREERLRELGEGDGSGT